MNIENIKTITDILVNISIITVFITGLKFFKYKLDSNDRKLYMESCFAVKTVISNVYSEGRITEKDIAVLVTEYQKAKLYLDKEIITLITNIYDLAIKAYEMDLNRPTDNVKKSQHSDKLVSILSELNDYNDKIFNIYRKHIVTELNFRNFIKNFNKRSKNEK